LLAVAFGALAIPAIAGPLGLPDSARPGAVRPEETGKQIMPQEPPGDLMEIPSVVDRPLAVDEGPRVLVRQFRLLEAQDLPDFELSMSELEGLLNELIATRPEGFTIGQMQEAIDLVTRYYRQHGLILAQAIIPVQTVQEGVVDLQVFEGVLGRVLTEGNLLYDSDVLMGPFKKLIGKPVTKEDMESALLTLTNFPGLTVFGVFQPGQKVGTADIVLRVQEEDRWDFSMRVDNHGLQETGRNRFQPTVTWNNVTRGADRISLTVLQSYNPKNADFWAADYDRYLGGGFSAGFSIDRNRFDVGGELARQRVSGYTQNKNLWLDRAWIRSRQLNLASRLELELKKSVTYSRGDPSNLDKLSVLGLETSLDHVDARFKGLNFGTIELRQGFNDLFGSISSSDDSARIPAGSGLRPSRQSGSTREFAEGEFTKLFITGQRFQTLPRDFSLLVRGEYQWSDDLLVPMEQYSVGGPDNVRAFPPAQILLDRAGFWSAELIHPMPFITDVEAFGSSRTWGDLVKLSVFYDQAIGSVNEPLVQDPDGTVNFRGAGVQARFTWSGFLEARLIMAFEMGNEIPDNEHFSQLWGDLTYSF
jgi:hemolysin activation/secretion protein